MWHQTAVRLRKQYSNVSIGTICNLFGKTRHAFYDRLWHNQERYSHEQIVIEILRELKRDIAGSSHSNDLFAYQTIIIVARDKNGKRCYTGFT